MPKDSDPLRTCAGGNDRLRESNICGDIYSNGLVKDL